jgi:hypothetical protein
MKPCPVCGGKGEVEVRDQSITWFRVTAVCGDCSGTGWARPPQQIASDIASKLMPETPEGAARPSLRTRIKPPFISAPRVCAELWEANGWCVFVDGRATGCTVREDEARSIVRWLEEALPELTRRLTTDALAKTAASV